MKGGADLPYTMYTNRTEFAQNQMTITRLTFTYEYFTKLTHTLSKVPLRFTELKLIFSNWLWTKYKVRSWFWMSIKLRTVATHRARAVCLNLYF